MSDDGQLGFEDALTIVRDLADEFTTSTGRPMRSVVVVGGTALAAHAIRDRSGDLDVYLSDIDDDVLDRVTRRHAAAFGPLFKIAATPSNTLWGAIALADIEDSPIVRQLLTMSGPLAVRALSPETLYVVKAAADRDKDQPDIVALSKRAAYADVVRRARTMAPWYADRSAFPEHAERLARYLSRDYGISLNEVDDDLAIGASMQAKVRDIRAGLARQFLNVLKALMLKYPEFLSFDARDPHRVQFDARRAGASDEVLAVLKERPGETADMAALVLRRRDPARHLEQLAAVKRLSARPSPTG